MALFGKKKRSLEEIMQDIEALSEEEKNELLLKMQPEKPETSEEAPEPAVEEENDKTVENETLEETETPEASTEETAETAGEAAGPTETETEAPAEEAPTEEPVEMIESVPDTPLEKPHPEEQQTGGNYDELIAAQNARIDSLESQLSALKETVEKVVANQDNKNFGYSPKANFDDDVQTSRRDAILQGYAPRRAEQYK